MNDRPTGSYTHERLIALEDNHALVIKNLENLIGLARLGAAALGKYAAALQDGETSIRQAKNIRKEAGI